MKLDQTAKNYLRIIMLNAIIQVIFRLLETTLILLNFGVPKLLIQSEILGLIGDLITTNSILIVVYPVFYLISKISEEIANRLFVTIIAAMAVLHFLILKYFLYQLIPLDTSLFKYSFQEIAFTVNTSGVDYTKSALLLVVIISAITLSNNFLGKIDYYRIKSKFLYIILLIAVVVMCVFFISDIRHNNYAKNKSLFFYSRSLTYFFQKKADYTIHNQQDANGFRQLYPGKLFLNKEYPLLHEFKNINVFKSYFKKFDLPPTIVILIVEGLNNDFLYDFKGANLMPFLSNLKDKSLYWNRCFTLGERSFAAVPSLLGSLPYGEKGFTLLDKLPRHLSLVSILNANNYHTSFFYGQGAWFHQKDRFFKYNNIDLIFDNNKFAEKYRKIIVGNDNFFWGYDDKDLFNQFFEVTDTVRKNPRLDVVFTGTSHSPFAISDSGLYNARYSKVISGLKNDSNVAFFEKYRKYIQSVLFVDDALESFFRKYETLTDFDNTLFVITGDHPMTEIPITNSIKRYHVPLLVYSKKLITPKTFTHTVSHLDFYETILSFLSGYQIKVPEVSSALGSNLILDQPEREKRIAFMNDNREIIDYYSNNCFLSGEKLFAVGKDLSLKVLSDQKLLKKMKDELNLFKSTNYDVSFHEKIIPDSLYFKALNYNIALSSPVETSSSEIKSEYHTITRKVALANRPVFFSISFELLTIPDKDLCVVFQLSAKNDSLIYWQSSTISNDSKLFQAEIKIPKQNTSDSVVYFDSYFWNKNSKDFKFRNLKFQIYQKNPI